MPLIDLRPAQFRRLLRRRRETGGDRYDEVWDGVYVMSPIADNEHQKIATKMAGIIDGALGDVDGVDVFAGTNVTDRVTGWRENYRCPDVAVFLPGNPAQDRSSHWLGGPDFAVEIVSKGDRSRGKFEFYAKVGVRELMILNRRPWTMELYRRDDTTWTLSGTSTPDSAETVASTVLPLTFRLLAGEPRPRIEVSRADASRSWLI